MKKLTILLTILLATLTLSAQTYEEMVLTAMDYAEKEDYVGAEQSLKSAMRKEPANPGNAVLLVNLGTFQRNLGKLDEALITYNAAISKFPKPIFILHNRAALYCEMNKLDNALLDYSTILIEVPNDIEAIYRRGLILMTKNSLLDAEQDFEKVLALDSKYLPARSAMAMILKRKGKWEAAEMEYTKLLLDNKNNGELYFNRAECYLQMNKLARTQDDLAKAVEYGYEDPLLYVMRGQLRLAQYDKLSAKEDLMKAKLMGVDSEIVDKLLQRCK